VKKLVNGIIDFRQNMKPNHRETFARLALGQFPDSLFITCSDSRVAPNVFASTDPGDLLVVRNVGNLIPECGGNHGLSLTDESEGAAIEFAVATLKVAHVIICGHSECGGMRALYEGRDKIATPNLKAWLRHGEKALTTLNKEKNTPKELAPHNRLSQLNVLQQIENLKSYPIIQEALAAKKIKLHAWWFELATATVHFFDPVSRKFVEIDEKRATEIIESCN